MEQMVGRVHATQESARDSRGVIEYMAEVVTQTTAANHQIRDVSNEQMRNLEQLKAGQERLFQTFHENAAKVETTATIGDDLYNVTGELNALLARFTFERNSAINRGAHEKRATPRLQNHLRVNVLADGGDAIEAVSRDLSMTGMQLRLTPPLASGQSVTLRVFLPHDNREEYERQQGLELSARVMWCRREHEHHLCGFEFVRRTAEQERALKTCFDYFNKQPYYSDARPGGGARAA
jgi:methyl-accepting chemotaxis protein